MSNFYYITIATVPHRVLDRIKKKVAENGETIHVLAEAENRVIGWESHQNFGIKLKEVASFLNRDTINNDDIVLFTDAYDVAYYGNQHEIFEKFKSLNKPIIFGCERLCNPDPNLAYKYPTMDVEFPYLNSGMYIGYAWALQYCLYDYVYEDKDDDQRYWTHKFFKNTDLIGLDYDNLLFLNTVGIDMSLFKVDCDGGSRCAVYRDVRRPAFVHVNGPDKSLIDELN